MAHPKHADVRARFHRRCGYCAVSEEDTGGELTVDHYTPAVAGGDDSDENLVYSCYRCNQFKADFHPTDMDRARGHYVLHPMRDDFTRHVRLNENSGHIEAISETGRFHIALLHLNRASLVAHRLRNRHWDLLSARKQLLEDEIRELRAIIAAQERYISKLKQLLFDTDRS